MIYDLKQWKEIVTDDRRAILYHKIEMNSKAYEEWFRSEYPESTYYFSKLERKMYWALVSATVDFFNGIEVDEEVFDYLAFDVGDTHPAEVRRDNPSMGQLYL